MEMREEELLESTLDGRRLRLFSFPVMPLQGEWCIARSEEESGYRLHIPQVDQRPQQRGLQRARVVRRRHARVQARGGASGEGQRDDGAVVVLARHLGRFLCCVCVVVWEGRE